MVIFLCCFLKLLLRLYFVLFKRHAGGMEDGFLGDQVLTAQGFTELTREQLHRGL